MTDHLARLSRDTKARDQAASRLKTLDEAWRDSIKAALCSHTQTEVARAAGITQARVNQIAHGRR